MFLGVVSVGGWGGGMFTVCVQGIINYILSISVLVQAVVLLSSWSDSTSGGCNNIGFLLFFMLQLSLHICDISVSKS